MAQCDPDWQGDQRGGGEGLHRHRDMLEEPIWNAEIALPVRAVEEPLQHLADEAHAVALPRDQGVTSRCSPDRLTSATIARATESRVPTTRGVLKSRISPSRIRLPRPPSPIRAVTVTK